LIENQKKEKKAKTCKLEQTHNFQLYRLKTTKAEANKFHKRKNLNPSIPIKTSKPRLGAQLTPKD